MKAIPLADPSRGDAQVLSFSQVESYMLCPARWWFRYGLRVKSQPPKPLPMAWGSLVHSLVERIEVERGAGLEWSDLTDDIDAWRDEWRGEAEAAASDALNPYTSARFGDDLEELEKLWSAARWVVANYDATFAHLCEPLLLIEQPFVVRMRNARGVPRDDLYYEGIVDGLGIASDGETFVRERKTTGERKLRTFQLNLDSDLQSPGYLAALEWLGVSSQYGPPRSVSYEAIRRARPSIPKVVGKVLKDGTDKRRLSAAACDTTRGTALDVIIAEGLDYEQHSEQLDGYPGNEAFLARFTYPAPQSQVDNWRETVVAVARAMRAAQRDPRRAYCNRGWCKRFGCQFKLVCWARGQSASRSDFEDAGFLIDDEVRTPDRPYLVEHATIERLRGAGIDCTTVNDLQQLDFAHARNDDDTHDVPF